MQHEAKMWDGRFEANMAKSMEALSFSLHFDSKLLVEDIESSVAHCYGLQLAGILSESEYQTMTTALKQIRTDLLAGAALYEPSDEDIHMAVERILTNRIGELGKKLHTGRSRNDQVATDFRLYLKNRAGEILSQVKTLQGTLLALAEAHFGEVMPGYTHVQQAQPILYSHYILSLFFALERDAQRLTNFLSIHNKMPLGSGAIAGSSFAYDRRAVATQLGFGGVTPNSIDGTAHRDAALDLLHTIAVIGTTLSRYAEDFVNWSTWEFGFLTLHDAYSSGSSMMPQKKNPDSMELIRGKSGRLLGNYTALMTTVKGAPLSYSRDLQEDKEPVFDSVEQIKIILDVFDGAMKTARWNFAKMRSQMLPELLATDLADYLVEDGIPFREAHHIVGRLVGEAAKKGTDFLSLGDDSWNEVPNGQVIKAKLTYENSVGRRNIEGGTGPESVRQQIQLAHTLLARS